MWVLCGLSRVVNALAAGDGGTSRSASPAELINRRHHEGNPADLATPRKETTMRQALLYYMAQNWTAELHRQAQRDKPGRAAGQSRRTRPSPRAHRARSLPAVVARRVRTVLGGSP
jgi:hypothetical protein